MDPRDKRQFDDQGETWTVTRDTGVRTGASDAGHLPSPSLRGLHFTSSKGAHRFLSCGLDELPSRKELEALPEAELRRLLNLAR